MSNGFRGTVSAYQVLYMEKNAHLEQFLEQVTPFERQGRFEDSKPNGIAVIKVVSQGVSK